MVSQLWPTLDLNDDAPTWGQDVADKFAAVGSWFAGPTAPATTFAGQKWIDTSAAPVCPLKIRNQANAAWIVLLTDVETALGGGITTAKVDSRVHSASVYLGAISASGNYAIWETPTVNNIVVVDVSLISTAGVASSGTDLWTFQVRNVTDAVDLKAAVKSTNGAAITADAPYALGLDQNLTIGASKHLRFQVLKTGAPTALAGALVTVKFKITTP